MARDRWSIGLSSGRARDWAQCCYLLSEMVGNLLQLAVYRHIVMVVLGGVIACGITSTQTGLWVFEGMLLAQAVCLMLDEDADLMIEGPLDRIDHAALVSLLAVVAHFVILLRT